MTLVSTVIPCYNSGETIVRTISSIQNQTFKDVEIIVVNDGSDDAKTLKILNNIQKNIKVINIKNKGLAAARNIGIHEANSKYILPLDSDDYFLPNFIEKAIKLLENNEKIHYVFCNIRMFGEQEGVLDRNYNYFVQLFNNQLPYALFYEKKIWADVGGYDESMILGYEDWEFNIRLGKYGYHPLKIKEPLFYYNVSASGMLKSKSDNNYISILRYIRKKHNETYSIIRLYEIWKSWRDFPKPFSTVFYILMYLVTKYLPGNAYNIIYRRLKFLRQSERYSKLEKY